VSPSKALELDAGQGRVVRSPSKAAPRFDEVLSEFQDRVYDFCVRMLGDRDEAFDVGQEIFLSVHQHLSGFRADASVATWIFRIAKNHCLNRLKYLRRRQTETLDVLEEAFPGERVDGAPRPDEFLEAESERRLLSQAIAKLEDDHRLLVTLRDLEGLSYEEIVEITELPIGTVKSRLHRAREKLVDLLAPVVREGGA
jgi:RNA polymerase sigma-70 factor, ECF subfamily